MKFIRFCTVVSRTANFLPCSEKGGRISVPCWKQREESKKQVLLPGGDLPRKFLGFTKC